MKRLAVFFALLLVYAYGIAQDKVAVFVYSPTKLDKPTNALRFNIEDALNNSAQKKYIVVDRTDEFIAFLKQEYKYQEQGDVSNTQLVAAGQQFGANKVCGVVITDYGSEGYFVECKILDVKENRIERTAKAVLPDLGIKNSEKAAAQLASKLNLLSLEQQKAVKELNVGDDYEGYTYCGKQLRIGYLDASKKHGIAYVIDDIKSHRPNRSLWDPDHLNVMVPSCEQLLLIRNNRYILGINSEFWSSDIAKREKNGWGDWSEDWYYTIDFCDGKKHKRRCGLNNTKYSNMYIVVF